MYLRIAVKYISLFRWSAGAIVNTVFMFTVQSPDKNYLYKWAIDKVT